MYTSHTWPSTAGLLCCPLLSPSLCSLCALSLFPLIHALIVARGPRLSSSPTSSHFTLYTFYPDPRSSLAFANIMSRTLIAFAFVIAAAASVSASTCEVTPQSYNAGDGTVLTDVAHILTLTANCPPNVAPVYANLNGRTLAVVRGESGGYQVSWTQNIDKASSGSYDIQFFDDEGYQQLKKAQRSGSSGPAPLFSVPFSHSSPYRGPLFQAEFVVLVGGLILTYYAIALRLKIVAKKI